MMTTFMSLCRVCLAQDKDTLEVVAAKVIDVLSMERRGMSQMLEASRRLCSMHSKEMNMFLHVCARVRWSCCSFL